MSARVVRSCSPLTDSTQMLHEADEVDVGLLADGDIGALLARWDRTIRGRCHVRIRNPFDAEDVAQNVRLRLLDEFHRGKRYGGVPYRVVVHQVIGWTIGDFFAGRRIDEPLPDDWSPLDPRADGAETVVVRESFRQLLERLAPKDARICAMRFLQGLEIDDIAAELGMERNAVDQAIFRGRRELRRLMADGW
jgi:RNA polymerase sigma factor (sigma-70 family)